VLISDDDHAQNTPSIAGAALDDAPHQEIKPGLTRRQKPNLPPLPSGTKVLPWSRMRTSRASLSQAPTALPPFPLKSTPPAGACEGIDTAL